MCSREQFEELTRQIVSAYKETYGDDISCIYLYGSYARGDYTEHSDIDFVAIVHGDRQALQDQLSEVWDRASDIGSTFDMIISSTVIPYDEFETYRDTLPYYQNIIKDGLQVLLCQTNFSIFPEFTLANKVSDRNFQVNERNICPVSSIILLAIFLEAYNEMRQDYSYSSERYVGGMEL